MGIIKANDPQPLIVSDNRDIENAMTFLLKSLVLSKPQLGPDLITGGIIGIKTNSGMTLQFGFGALDGRVG